MHWSDQGPVGSCGERSESSVFTILNGMRSKVRIRSVASPMGRRYIQFSDGSLQSRLTLRVAVCD